MFQKVLDVVLGAGSELPGDGRGSGALAGIIVQ